MPNMMKALTRWVIIAASVATTLTACTSAPVKPAQFSRGDFDGARQYLASLIEHEMKKHEITGLSIALVDDQKIVWSQGFGYADKAASLAATPDTLYRVGSISKLFTATAVMQLAEQGKLDIDQPLHTMLPEFSIKTRFPDTSGAITPRNIMTHHSGLPGDLFDGMWTAKPEPFTGVVSRIRDEYVPYPPNYVFAYSNLGITLLGHTIEKISGSDFSTYMQQNLLLPMGMTHSNFSTHFDDKLMSKAYRAGAEDKEVPLRDVPAGGLNSSVQDMSRFMQMVFAQGRAGGREIIRPASLAEMLRPQNADIALDLDFHMGLGWMLSHGTITNAGTVARHGGATMLHRSELIVLPEQKLGVVVLSNSDSGEKIVTKLAETALKLALETKFGIAQTAHTTENPAKSQDALDPALYAGTYVTELGFAKLEKDGKGLVATLGGKRLELLPCDEGRACLQYKLLGLLPIPVESLDKLRLSRAQVAGREIIVANSEGTNWLAGERIKPVPISEHWLKRQGNYQLIGTDSTDAIQRMLNEKGVSLKYADGYLNVEHGSDIVMTLAPLSDTEALIRGLGRGKQETVRVVTIDGAEYLTYSGLVLKKKPAS